MTLFTSIFLVCFKCTKVHDNQKELPDMCVQKQDIIHERHSDNTTIQITLGNI